MKQNSGLKKLVPGRLWVPLTYRSMEGRLAEKRLENKRPSSHSVSEGARQQPTNAPSRGDGIFPTLYAEWYRKWSSMLDIRTAPNNDTDERCTPRITGSKRYILDSARMGCIRTTYLKRWSYWVIAINMLGGSAYGAMIRALGPRLNVVTSIDSPQAHRNINPLGCTGTPAFYNTRKIYFTIARSSCTRACLGLSFAKSLEINRDKIRSCRLYFSIHLFRRRGTSQVPVVF